MEKQMKRTVYEAPTTERIRIELESDFMTASVVNDKNKGEITIEGQEVEVVDGTQWGDADHNFGWE